MATNTKMLKCKMILNNDTTVTLASYLGLNRVNVSAKINGKGEYRSVKICVAYGGPNIYVDTQTKSVNLFWCSTKTTWGIKEATSNKIDDLFEEYYNATKNNNRMAF